MVWFPVGADAAVLPDTSRVVDVRRSRREVVNMFATMAGRR
ncbi:hypothetical protein ABT121_01905 [Streptomyces sp. NPDC001928]